jgi:hypothetical protein
MPRPARTDAIRIKNSSSMPFLASMMSAGVLLGGDMLGCFELVVKSVEYLPVG